MYYFAYTWFDWTLSCLMFKWTQPQLFQKNCTYFDFKRVIPNRKILVRSIVFFLFKMELFGTINDGWESLKIFGKNSMLDVA